MLKIALRTGGAVTARFTEGGKGLYRIFTGKKGSKNKAKATLGLGGGS